MDFSKLGQLAGLFQNLPKIQQEMERFQQKLGQITADGEAGGGMARVRVNGKMEVLSVVLADEAFKGGDKELLEDVLVSAVNQAMQKVRQLVAEETTKMATGLGLPTGMSLPGMS